MMLCRNVSVSINWAIFHYQDLEHSTLLLINEIDVFLENCGEQISQSIWELS